MMQDLLPGNMIPSAIFSYFCRVIISSHGSETFNTQGYTRLFSGRDAAPQPHLRKNQEDLLKAKADELNKILAEEKERLHKISNMSPEEAKILLLSKLESELNREKSVLIKKADDEIKEIIQNKIKELGAVGPKDMGKVMSEVIKAVKGKADGKIINSLVRDILSG